MIRSFPHPVFHSNNIFGFKSRAEERWQSFLEAHDDLNSNHSGQDEESLASPTDCFRNKRSYSLEDCEEVPLNLTCKRRKIEDVSHIPIHSNHSVEKSGASMNWLERHIGSSPSEMQMLSHEALKTAAKQYRAQVLTSNDLAVSALMQRKWQETFPASFITPFIAVGQPQANQWFPAATTYYPYGFQFRPVPTNTVYNQWRETLNTQRDNESMMTNPTLMISSPPSFTAIPISMSSASPAANLKTSSLHDLTQIEKTAARTEKPWGSSTKISPSQVYDKPLKSFVPNCKEEEEPEDTLKEKNQCSSSPDLTALIESSRKRRAKRSRNSSASNIGDSFPCSICSASYPHKFELNRHVKVSHVRPHRCNECGKGFGHRNYLKVHIETVHMGQKSHQCRLCGKYLSTGGNLNVHIRTIHLGEKKYDCPICNRSFGQQCNMKTHMKRHYSKSDEL